MVKSSISSQRLIAVFLLGCILFNYPLLSLFSGDQHVFGVPLLFVFLFASWVFLIVLMALITEVLD
ncbi:MAG TPA: hypothetical protein VMK05_11080 [Burkholderiales bacterium]|nr:hypothetical protein [Burkholderiales bacterium]